MSIFTITSMIITSAILYLLFTKKKNLSKKIYFFPFLAGIIIVAYNVITNPGPITTTMMIAGVAGALLLSLELCIPFYFINKALKK